MIVDIAGTWIDVPFFYHPRRNGHSRVQEINGTGDLGQGQCHRVQDHKVFLPTPFCF